jgi:hypothetical protein
MKKIFNIITFILLFIWQLPQNIVALIMMPFLGKLKLISYKNYNYCFEGEKMSGGISLGNFSFVSPYSAKVPETIAHEQTGHVKQSHILGWLYLIIIGLPSILWCWSFRMLGFHNYYIFYTESWANKNAGLEVEETYPNYFTLKFKD